MSHTPGPWQLVGPHQDATHIIAMPKDATKLGAGVAWAVSTLEREEAVANARLIAAAPDLLDAVKIAYLWVSRLDGTNEHTQKQLAVWEKLIDTVEGK